MDIQVDEIMEWIMTLSPLSIYSIFFLIAYIENIIPPIPGDVLVVFGGFLAAEQIVGFGNLLMLTTVASAVGFMTMYAIGSFWGFKIEMDDTSSSWIFRWVGMKYFDRGKRWMQRWGQWVIVVNRFLAGTRTVIALTAGIYRTKFNYTLASATISSLLWNLLLLSFGWFVHENWQVIGDYLNIYGWAILGLLVLLVAVRLYFSWRKRNVLKNNKKHTGES